MMLLSTNVIQSRIVDFSLDILEQLISHVEEVSPFKISLQLGESTDVLNCSQFL